jgi:Fe-S-cluster-containing dehydrogenase component
MKIYKRKCDFCKKYYEGRGKFFCSRKCKSSAFYFNNNNLTFKGKHHSKESKLKISLKHLNEKNPNWKNNKAGYTAIHHWITRRKLKPKFCERYKRDINDYIWLTYDLANISQKYEK